MPLEESRHLNRRDAPATGLAAAGTLARGTPSFRADSPETGPYAPFRMDIQSYSLRTFDFDEALARTRAYGLHYRKSYSAASAPIVDADRIERVKAHAKAAGINVNGFGVVHFDKGVDQNLKLCEFGKRPASKYFSCDPAFGSFDGLDKPAEEFGIPRGIHNYGSDHAFAKIDTCRGDQGPSSQDWLPHRYRPLPPVQRRPRPRRRGVRQSDLRRPFQGRQGRQDFHRARRRRPAAGGPLESAYQARLSLRARPGVRRKTKGPDADIRACLAVSRKAVAAL